MFDGHPVLKAYGEKVRADNIRFLVSAVAWNIAISAVPLAVGVLAVTQIAMPGSKHREISRQVSRALQGVLQPKELDRVVALTIHHNVLLVAIAIGSALWGAWNVGFAISAAFNAMFEVRGRELVREKLVDLGMFFVLLLLTFGIVAATAAQGVATRAIEGTSLPNILLTPVSTVFSLACAFVLFSVIYAVYPNTHKRIELENLWLGSLVAAVLFQILTYIWPLYEKHFQQYGGFLFPFLVLVVWIYFFSLILVLGAEVVALNVIRDAKERGEEVGPAPSSNVPEHRSLTHRRRRAS